MTFWDILRQILTFQWVGTTHGETLLLTIVGASLWLLIAFVLLWLFTSLLPLRTECFVD